MPRIVIAVLLTGFALRAGLTIALPARTAFDDHFEPVQLILSQGRVPNADDCWECYQPPVYYVISAGTWKLSEEIAKLGGATQRLATEWGKKSLQWVSCAAGCLTLYLAWLILPRAGVRDSAVQAAALAVIAFLPAHIQMSGMATNDALTYCVATGAILATLRANERSWRIEDCIVAGALAGATVLCKGYGLVTVAAIVAAVGLWTLRYGRGAQRGLPAIWILLAAAFVGSGPALRNVVIHGRPHVDNFDKFRTLGEPTHPMLLQPPGDRSAIDYFSFRFGALLDAPWLHTRHLDSFWTEMYGRLWFDYEGFNATLSGYPAWEAHVKRTQEVHRKWSRERWDMRLSYAPSDVPPHFRWIGVTMYWIGLPITALVLAGVAVGAIESLRRLVRRREPLETGAGFARLVLTLHFFAAVCVPVVQALRLPHFSAMKVAFALSAVSSGAAAAGWVLALPRGRLRGLLLGVCGGLVTIAAAVQIAYVLMQFALGRR